MDTRPTLVLFEVDGGYRAAFEDGEPLYQEADLDALSERYYLVIVEGDA